jgi:hypothetical protein
MMGRVKVWERGVIARRRWIFFGSEADDIVLASLDMRCNRAKFFFAFYLYS